MVTAKIPVMQSGRSVYIDLDWTIKTVCHMASIEPGDYRFIYLPAFIPPDLRVSVVKYVEDLYECFLSLVISTDVSSVSLSDTTI